MRMLIVLTVLLGLAAPVLAVESRSLPASAAPGYLAGPQAPLVSSPTVGAPVVPLPPHLPARLPSGGVNLDEAWIQDGGARLYWNTLVIPRQLRMGGASFVDPAAVPELLPVDSDKVVRPARRRVPARAVTSAEKQKPGQRTAPAGAGSTTLKPPRRGPPQRRRPRPTSLWCQSRPRRTAVPRPPWRFRPCLCRLCPRTRSRPRLLRRPVDPENFSGHCGRSTGCRGPVRAAARLFPPGPERSSSCAPLDEGTAGVYVASSIYFTVQGSDRFVQPRGYAAGAKHG